MDAVVQRLDHQRLMRIANYDSASTGNSLADRYGGTDRT
jgi:hypothetical protein